MCGERKDEKQEDDEKHAEESHCSKVYLPATCIKRFRCRG
jgi:hypothetical protein